MITVLVDHDIEGQAALLWSTFVADGWLEFTPLQFVTFDQIRLAHASPDRIVWELAQKQRMILLTGNRNMDGKDSLEQTIQDANTPTSLPIITIANVSRMVETAYRKRCAARLAEIGFSLEEYLGTGRLFIP
jgi:hypothetical protein